MHEFFQAAIKYDFVQRAVLAGILISVSCGITGTYVVVRRITYLAGGIAHCVLGGMGAAIYLSKVHGITWATPMAGAVLAALLAAGIIGIVTLKFSQREDTVISAMWAIGMASGILFLWACPGYQEDLMSYLFGNILLVSQSDLWIIAALDAFVILMSLLFYKQFAAVCFDEQFARTRRVNTNAFFLLLLMLTALSVVLLVTVVGIVMVIALLTLPVAAAGLIAKRMGHMMILAVVFSMLFATGGLMVSYSPNLPAGATTIILAGACYIVLLAAKGIFRVFARTKN